MNEIADFYTSMIADLKELQGDAEALRVIGAAGVVGLQEIAHGKARVMYKEPNVYCVEFCDNEADGMVTMHVLRSILLRQ